MLLNNLSTKYLSLLGLTYFRFENAGPVLNFDLFKKIPVVSANNIDKLLIYLKDMSQFVTLPSVWINSISPKNPLSSANI